MGEYFASVVVGVCDCVVVCAGAWTCWRSPKRLNLFVLSLSLELQNRNSSLSIARQTSNPLMLLAGLAARRIQQHPLLLRLIEGSQQIHLVARPLSSSCAPSPGRRMAAEDGAAQDTAFYAPIRAASGAFKYHVDGAWLESTSGKTVGVLNPQTGARQYEVQGMRER